MHKKFSIEEAEKLLPEVTKLMKKAQRIRDRLAWLMEANDVSVEVTSEEGFHFFLTEQVSVNKEFHKLYYHFYRAVEKLNEMGLIVKDIDEGLVDFPFELKGRELMLCWRLGEDKIKYWHTHEEGFEGRQPIVDIDELFKEKNL